MFRAGGTPATKQEALSKMHEDDYTGSLLGDDDDEFLAADTELFDWEADDDALDPEFSYGASGEEHVNVLTAADGAKTLKEVAEMLYDFADELLELSAAGFELIDDIKSGHGIAVALSDDDPN